jgi:hypothetical protein
MRNRKERLKKLLENGSLGGPEAAKVVEVEIRRNNYYVKFQHSDGFVSDWIFMGKVDPTFEIKVGMECQCAPVVSVA